MDDLMSTGIAAFREGKYGAAIACLTQVDPADPSIWLARFYLAMSYERSGQTVEALGLYKAINAMCADGYLKMTSDNARKLLEGKSVLPKTLKRTREKEPSLALA